jgi:hypothetical protein
MRKLWIATVVAASALGIGATRADESGFYREPATVSHAADSAYVPNGSFDWRHRRRNEQVPWYAYSQSGHCFVWTPNAYHYACDPNSRY